MSTLEVYDGSSCLLEPKFTDKNEDSLTPDKVEWWVIEPRSGEIKLELQEQTSPGESSIEINIAGEVNICSGRRDEERLAIVKATSGEHVAHYPYPYHVIAIPSVPYEA